MIVSYSQCWSGLNRLSSVLSFHHVSVCCCSLVHIVAVIIMSGNTVGRLQELAQVQGVGAPLYVVEDAQGESHCPTFTIRVSWNNQSAVGVGKNKVRLIIML